MAAAPNPDPKKETTMTTDNKTPSRGQTLINRLVNPVTITLPGYGLVALGAMVLALVVVAID